MDSIAVIIGILLGCVSLVSSAWGLAAYIRASARKNYAAERDMNHFKNNQLQLRESIEYFRDQTEQSYQVIHTRLIEIEHKIDTLISRIKQE